jgi:hypothetical protein
MNVSIDQYEDKRAFKDYVLHRGADTNISLPSFIRANPRKSEIWNGLKREFAAMGISARTIDSLALVPLVETAMDDGIITQNEKDKVLGIMKNIRILSFGIDPNLGEAWVRFKGRTGFLLVWTVYLRDLCGQIPPEKRNRLKALIVETCAFVIQTLDGFLTVPDFESRIISAIERAFASEKTTSPMHVMAMGGDNQ